MKVGFIGLGYLGRPIAESILKAGYDLTVHDIRKETGDELVEKGAVWADTPKAVAKSCQVVLSCLPGPPQVQEIVYGSNGLMASWKKGDIYVDMTSNSPVVIRQVAKDAKAKGVSVLDVAVSKYMPDAAAGELTLMVGGDIRSFKAVRKILAVIGRWIFHVGDVGLGTTAKIINNMIGITSVSVTSAGFVLGVKSGIDPQTLLEIIKVSTGNSSTLHSYPTRIFKGHFEPGFKLSLALKDLGLALALGKEYDIPLPLVAAAEQTLIEAKAKGFGDKHVNAVILPLEQLAGVQVRSDVRNRKCNRKGKKV